MTNPTSMFSCVSVASGRDPDASTCAQLVVAPIRLASSLATSCRCAAGPSPSSIKGRLSFEIELPSPMRPSGSSPLPESWRTGPEARRCQPNGSTSAAPKRRGWLGNHARTAHETRHTAPCRQGQRMSSRFPRWKAHRIASLPRWRLACEVGGGCPFHLELRVGKRIDEAFINPRLQEGPGQ